MNRSVSYFLLFRKRSWQVKQTEIRLREKFVCFICARYDESLFEIEHLDYQWRREAKEPWAISNFRLVGVCEHCHGEFLTPLRREYPKEYRIVAIRIASELMANALHLVVNLSDDETIELLNGFDEVEEIMPTEERVSYGHNGLQKELEKIAIRLGYSFPQLYRLNNNHPLRKLPFSYGDMSDEAKTRVAAMIVAQRARAKGWSTLPFNELVEVIINLPETRSGERGFTNDDR